MKKRLTLFIDILILISVWLFFILSVGFLMVVMLYFPESNLSVLIAGASALLLAAVYTIFWVKRFKKSRTK